MTILTIILPSLYIYRVVTIKTPRKTRCHLRCAESDPVYFISAQRPLSRQPGKQILANLEHEEALPGGVWAEKHNSNMLCFFVGLSDNQPWDGVGKWIQTGSLAGQGQQSSARDSEGLEESISAFEFPHRHVQIGVDDS